MATTIREVREVCYSCAAAVANGVDSVEGDGVEAWRIRFAEAVTHHGGRVPVMLWTFDDNYEPFYFSKTSCDYCGDRLAGDRCDAVIE